MVMAAVVSVIRPSLVLKKCVSSFFFAGEFFSVGEKKMKPSEEVLCKWFKARDLFLGLFRDYRDPVLGRRRALEVAHLVPAAYRLCSVISEADSRKTHAFIRAKLEQAGEFTYAAFYRYNKFSIVFEREIERRAENGCTFAMGLVQYACGPTRERILRGYIKSVEAGDPQGMLNLAYNNDELYLDLLCKASRLGDYSAMREFVTMSTHPREERIHWACELLVALGNLEEFSLLDWFISDQWRMFETNNLPIRSFYPIAKAFAVQGVSVVSPQHCSHDFVHYYHKCNNHFRRDVKMSLLVTRRFGVVKDIRCMIAKMLWAQRLDLTYMQLMNAYWKYVINC
jgi:hypothetical protein